MNAVETKVGRKEWPKRVTVGNVTVKCYRAAHATARSGFIYTLVYGRGGTRQREKFADPVRALEEARLKATQLNAGMIDAADMTAHDRGLLQEVKRVCGTYPVLAALKEALSWFSCKPDTNPS